MSLLTIIQRFAQEINIDEPTSVMGNTDPQIKQVKALLQKEGDDLAGRGDWEVLVNEAKITFAGITGTVDSAAGTAITDSDATFTTDISVGDTIYNTSTGESSFVGLINSDVILNTSTNDVIFTTAGETYTVFTNDLTLDQIASNNFRYIRNDTIWDRTNQLPVYIIDPSDWQQVIATAVTGPRHQARIRGGELLITPAPTIGDKWAFEYVTWSWMTDSTGATHKQYFTNDGDLPLLPETLLEAGLQWRWKKQKGMEYAEDFRTYEIMVANELSRNGLKRPLKLHSGQVTPEPKVFIPNGSWNL